MNDFSDFQSFSFKIHCGELSFCNEVGVIQRSNSNTQNPKHILYFINY